MPRAMQGQSPSTLDTQRPRSLIYYEGVLVECDPSIKAIITRINEQRNHEIIVEDIDDEHVLIKKDKHDELKLLLKEVSPSQRWVGT